MICLCGAQGGPPCWLFLPRHPFLTVLHSVGWAGCQPMWGPPDLVRMQLREERVTGQMLQAPRLTQKTPFQVDRFTEPSALGFRRTHHPVCAVFLPLRCGTPGQSLALTHSLTGLVLGRHVARVSLWVTGSSSDSGGPPGWGGAALTVKMSDTCSRDRTGRTLGHEACYALGIKTQIWVPVTRGPSCGADHSLS